MLGVSGGPDSLAMLHVLRRLAGEYGVMLHVGHLNHGLRGAEADADAAHVAALSAEWGIPCTVESADVAAVARERRLAIEEAARQVRYAFLARLARAVGGRTVAVAHNADDQVETVLMHLLRGAGLAGLRGMRPVSRLEELRLADPSLSADEAVPPGRTGCAPYGPSWEEGGASIRLIRPLLEVTRADVEAYCRAHGLQPRFDASNLDRTFYRNRLRHELIPYLETYNPNVRQVIRRMAEAIAGDYDLLRQQLAEVWPRVVRHASSEALTLDLTVLRGLPVGLQRSVLREAVHCLRRSLRNINWVHIDDAVRVLAEGQVGAAATLPRGLLLTIGYDVATLAPAGHAVERSHVPRIAGEIAPLPVPGRTPLGGGWVLVIERIPRGALPDDWRENPDPYVAYLDAERCAGPLALRTRREGDWFIPLGLGHRQRVRDLMINAKVPRDERDGLPLLTCGSEIAWVVGLRLDERFAVTHETTEVLVARVSQGLAEAGV